LWAGCPRRFKHTKLGLVEALVMLPPFIKGCMGTLQKLQAGSNIDATSKKAAMVYLARLWRDAPSHKAKTFRCGPRMSTMRHDSKAIAFNLFLAFFPALLSMVGFADKPHRR